MTMRTRLLYEIFMPREARFPDEKFWNRDGSPIHPKPKGPPPGTRGKTHADIGAHDRDDYPNIPQDVYPNPTTVKGDHPDAFSAAENAFAVSPGAVEYAYDAHGRLCGRAHEDDPWYVWDEGADNWFEQPQDFDPFEG